MQLSVRQSKSNILLAEVSYSHLVFYLIAMFNSTYFLCNKELRSVESLDRLLKIVGHRIQPKLIICFMGK